MIFLLACEVDGILSEMNIFGSTRSVCYEGKQLMYSCWAQGKYVDMCRYKTTVIVDIESIYICKSKALMHVGASWIWPNILRKKDKW
jgi:hypothetical protein